MLRQHTQKYTQISKQVRWGLVGALGLFLFSLTLSMILGSGEVGWREVWAVLRDAGDAQAQFVVWDLRMPRTLIASCVGMALACAGAMLQAASRNPLAEPGLLGVSAGAATAVVFSIAFGLSMPNVQVLVAIAGALVGCMVVLVASRLGGLADDPVRLVIAGAALSSILTAASALVLLWDQRTADEVRFWTIGGVAGRSLNSVAWAFPSLVLGMLGTCLVARPLAALALGEAVASGLGQRPQMIRVVVVCCVALLVGAATAMAGPIGFVGLVVPFVARWISGPDIRPTLLLAAILGPSFVLLADTLSRLIAPPTETPLGVLTALIGAPVLVLIVRRRRLPMV